MALVARSLAPPEAGADAVPETAATALHAATDVVDVGAEAAAPADAPAEEQPQKQAEAAAAAPAAPEANA